MPVAVLVPPRPRRCALRPAAQHQVAPAARQVGTAQRTASRRRFGHDLLAQGLDVQAADPLAAAVVDASARRVAGQAARACSPAGPLLHPGQHRRLVGVGELHDRAGGGLHRVDLADARPVGSEHVALGPVDEPLLVVVRVHVVARRVGELHHLHARRRLAVLPFLRTQNVTLCHLWPPCHTEPAAERAPRCCQAIAPLTVRAFSGTPAARSLRVPSRLTSIEDARRPTRRGMRGNLGPASPFATAASLVPSNTNTKRPPLPSPRRPDRPRTAAPLAPRSGSTELLRHETSHLPRDRRRRYRLHRRRAHARHRRQPPDPPGGDLLHRAQPRRRRGTAEHPRRGAHHHRLRGRPERRPGGRGLPVHAELPPRGPGRGRPGGGQAPLRGKASGGDRAGGPPHRGRRPRRRHPGHGRPRGPLQPHLHRHPRAGAQRPARRGPASSRATTSTTWGPSSACRATTGGWTWPTRARCRSSAAPATRWI